MHGELMVNLFFNIEIKFANILLERNSLSDALYWNSGMIINEQGHPLNGMPYRNSSMMIKEQGLIATPLVVRYMDAWM